MEVYCSDGAGCFCGHNGGVGGHCFGALLHFAFDIFLICKCDAFYNEVWDVRVDEFAVVLDDFSGGACDDGFRPGADYFCVSSYNFLESAYG